MDQEKREVIVEYQLRPDDVYKPFQWTPDNIIRWVLALILGYTLYVRYRADSATVRSFENGNAIVAIIAVLTVLIVLGLLLYPYLHVRARFKKSAERGGKMRAEFRDEGIRLANAVGTSDLKWSAFTRATETSRAFSLGSAAKNYVFLPKRFLTKADEAVLRDLIRKNLKGKLRLLAG